MTNSMRYQLMANMDLAVNRKEKSYESLLCNIFYFCSKFYRFQGLINLI